MDEAEKQKAPCREARALIVGADLVPARGLIVRETLVVARGRAPGPPRLEVELPSQLQHPAVAVSRAWEHRDHTAKSRVINIRYDPS